MNSKKKHQTRGILLVFSFTAAYVAIASILHLSVTQGFDPGPFVHLKVAIESGNRLMGFTVTAYCPGSCCNSHWAGMTATGKSMNYFIKRGRNIAAVDPDVIPLGSRILYNNRVYEAVDVGSGIKGRSLDILLPDHASTEAFGVRVRQTIVVLR